MAGVGWPGASHTSRIFYIQGGGAINTAEYTSTICMVKVVRYDSLITKINHFLCSITHQPAAELARAKLGVSTGALLGIFIDEFHILNFR